MLIIVTDPCYILSEEDWQKAIETETIDEKLREISGDEKAVVAPTKVGDWVNRMESLDKECEIATGKFAADSGMVCVVKWTPELMNYVSKNATMDVYPDCVARLKVPDDAMYELNSLGETTVVKIWLGEFDKLIAKSEG